MKQRIFNSLEKVATKAKDVIGEPFKRGSCFNTNANEIIFRDVDPNELPNEFTPIADNSADYLKMEG